MVDGQERFTLEVTIQSPDPDAVAEARWGPFDYDTAMAVCRNLASRQDVIQVVVKPFPESGIPAADQP